jgi:elongator complex protein 1
MNVVVLNYDYDPLTEHSLEDSDFGESEFITVGWGKKETQFHGSEGKEAAKKKDEIKALENLDEVDKTCSITWRGDGEYFAVSFVHPQRGRSFKVFNKEGQLQFTSELCNGLEAPIFWRPSGLWIAVPQVLPGNKYQITLFEKNGLRHRELVLPFKRQEQFVKSISWNSDSEILLIETQHVANEKQSSVYLYTICNYHWYLKQFFPFRSMIASYAWSFDGKLLHILLESGTIESFKWEFDVNHSSGYGEDDEGVVAVIDGWNILLTNFRGTIIPPPMCGYQLTVENPVNQVGFLSHQANVNSFFVVDAVTGAVSTYEAKFTSNAKDAIPVNRLNGAQLLQRYDFENATECSRFLWVAPTLFVCLHNGALTLMETVGDQLKVVSSHPLESIVVTMQADDRVIYFQDLSGCVQKVEIELNNTISAFQHLFLLPEICDKLEIAQNATNKMPAQVYALKNRHNLYCNQSKLASDVTSFHLTDRYVAFTSLTHLYFIKLAANGVDSKQQVCVVNF